MSIQNPESRLTVPEIVQKYRISTQDVHNVLLESMYILLEQKYGQEKDIFKVTINNKNDIELSKSLFVVENKTNYFNEIDIKDAKAFMEEVKVGDTISYPVEISREFNINEKSILKNLIKDSLRDITKQREYERFEKKLYTIALATVKSSPRNLSQEIIVEIDNTDCVLYSNKSLPMDRLGLAGAVSFGAGSPSYPREQIYVYIYKVQRNNDRAQVFVSRTCTELVECIIKDEIPFFDRKIEIKAIARIPGVRTKVAVMSKDPSNDAVISCVGTKGVIANAISKKLGTREKVIFIHWSNDLAVFIDNCMSPTPVICAVMSEDQRLLEVIVADSEFVSDEYDNSKTPALKKQTAYNAALCGRLINRKVLVRSESDFNTNNADIKSKETHSHIENLIGELNISEEFAELLYVNGVSSPWDLYNTTAEELSYNFDDLYQEIAEELVVRVKEFCDKENPKYQALFKENEGEDSLYCFCTLTPRDSVMLAQAGITSIEKLSNSNMNTIVAILKNKKTSGEIMQIITSANLNTN